MLLVNLKTYEESTADNAVKLAKQLEEAAKKFAVKTILVAQNLDIIRLSGSTSLDIWAQHADEVDFGAHTGHVPVEALMMAGAKGTIINHSENRIEHEKIRKIIDKMRTSNFPVLVCVKDPEEAEAIAKFNPDYIAYEPPELIGGEISVSTSKPEVVKEAIDKVGDIPLIIGAGIKNQQDIKIGLELGAKGFLVASGVIKAENPGEALKDLLEGFKDN